eukprot:TRINITY_DN8722_c0_g2_i2.p2 TRINITY_DN8722_c0_g2~~TRINITY_DN8722_c0_g2_i2.p2  ORF type:complete len:179 (+),score=22.72 TRINITY_DN8722_c0_g2_i2:50-538(+)
MSADSNAAKLPVVQAQVVQAHVVQAQPAQAQVVGQPVQVVYQPAPGYTGPPMPIQIDQQGAQQAWILYGIGCFLCWCCGPCGPCFWYAVACMYFCKPEEQRKHLQEQRNAAICSLVTAIISTVLLIALIIVYVAFVAAAVDSAEDMRYSSYQYYYSYSYTNR